ncbi:threonine-phosphate decarboxylase [Lysobacteraceae bacterium NML08-0793]|nr:threonine-phosphate decarboxylase [Xanthomonadaceae bacterium NML08-0793]
MLEHGGRLNRAAARYGIAAEHWLDLSTGISPRPWPVPPVPPTIWQRLPEDDDALLPIARRYYGTADVWPVAGSQAAILALPRLRARSRVAVLTPGYAEHAHAWQNAGHQVELLPADKLLGAAQTHDVLVLINPCNPSGAVFSPAALRDAHARLAERGGWLVVDEAFMDATPENSLCADSQEGLWVLRSVGKFFGLAGIRAGFVCTAAGALQRLAEYLGPWALNGPARWLLCRALADTAWQTTQRQWLQAQGMRLESLLAGYGMRTTGTAFFRYWQDPRAAELAAALARRAILVRQFAAPSALRFGLPDTPAAWQRLEHALQEIGA